jgi:hypothetical protein
MREGKSAVSRARALQVSGNVSGMDGSSTPTLALIQILLVAIVVKNAKQRGTIGACRLPANNSPVYVLSILKASAHPSIQPGMTRLANFAMGTSFARFPRCPRTWLQTRRRRNEKCRFFALTALLVPILGSFLCVGSGAKRCYVYTTTLAPNCTSTSFG